MCMGGTPKAQPAPPPPPPPAPTRLVDTGVQAARSQAITDARRANGNASTILTGGNLAGSDQQGQTAKTLLGQ